MNIIGQDSVKTFLESRIDSIPHTMLFCGPSGSGKSEAARELAKALGYSVEEIDPDGDTYKIKQIRDILKKYRESSNIVFVINQADKLIGPSASILLKSLEDTKNNVLFILTATDYAVVPYTLYSRCVLLEFNSLSCDDIQEYLRVKHNVWNEHFAKIANGSFKMADEVASGNYLTSRNQVWSFLNEIKFINEDNLSLPDKLKSDTNEFISIGLNLLYDLIKVNKGQTDLVVNTDLMEEYHNWLDRYSLDFAIFCVICFRDILTNYPDFMNKNLHLKTLLLKLKLGSVPL